jgi:hypothetical protein
MTEWGFEHTRPSARGEQRWRRRAYLPGAIERCEAKLERLRQEAAGIGLSLTQLQRSQVNGDLIASEYLKRLGYFR